MELHFLRDLIIIFGVAVLVVAFLHRFGIPTIAGFILAGTLAGPQGLQLVSDIHQVEVLAEIGVVLLLFSIGSEFSLVRLKRLWQPILIGGTIQVTSTILVTLGFALYFGLPLQSGIFAGFLIAVSSTAIVLRGLEARGELDAPHGQLALGILLFQDLCVVPMMFSLPLLSGTGESFFYLVLNMGRALLLLIIVLAVAWFMAPKLMAIVARTRQRDLFVLAVLLVCIGIAWAASKTGISLALGAFLAGLVVAGSDFRHQALSELIPFREAFTSMFFVSVGMLLDPEIIVENWGTILFLLIMILFGKFLLVFGTGVLMRLPMRVCIMSAATLAQVGEFSFVLSYAARGKELLSVTLSEEILAASILSMLITPFAISLAPKLAAGAVRIRSLTRFLDVKTAQEAQKETRELRDHVIIAGYGYAGREVGESLKQCRIPYVITGLNVDSIRNAVGRGEPAYFGDICSPEVLHSLRAEKARELVLVINDPSAIERVIRTARRLAPQLHIIVRTRYLLDAEPALKAGANEVVTEEIESAVEVANRILDRHKIPFENKEPQLERIRRFVSTSPPP